jgi:hypothetical protein
MRSAHIQVQPKTGPLTFKNIQMLPFTICKLRHPVLAAFGGPDMESHGYRF